MKVLYISNAIPYGGIKHAGGKTLNYYVNSLLKDSEFEAKLIGICKEEELRDIQSTAMALEYIPIISKGSFWRNVVRCTTDLFGICAMRRRYGQSYYKTSRVLNELKKLKQQGFDPEVIFLEWTNMVLMVTAVADIFPDAKLIASEHDVSFLGAERRYLRESGFKQRILKQKYEQLKQQELKALSVCDVIMPQNDKDKKLLVKNGVPAEKIFVLTPYYHDMSHVKRCEINHDILFWGAMNREENYTAALWFIDHVMPLLQDTDVRFIVAGNRPPKVLMDRSGAKVVVTGFVEDEQPLFAQSMCFVSPLLLGAGIKVKVLEAMSTGIPVLTNQIGIEGIPAVDNIHYFHCETAEDYAKAIRHLMADPQLQHSLEEQSKAFMKCTFDLHAGSSRYVQMIKSLGSCNQ